jgi:hypothetical protein
MFTRYGRALVCVLASIIFVPLLGRRVLDEITVRLYTPEGVYPIFRSDVRPSLTGMPRTLRDVIMEAIMYAHAVGLKIPPDEEQAERYLERIQDRFGLSREALNTLLEESGYTFIEAKQELMRSHLVESVMEMHMSTHPRLHISMAEVKEYDEQHPLYRPAEYTLQDAYIPFRSVSEAEFDAAYGRGTISSMVTWGESFTLKDNELSSELMQALSGPLTPGQIVHYEKDAEGVNLYKLVSFVPRTRVPLEEHYSQIFSMLEMQRRREVYEEVCEDLLAKASLAFVYPEDEEFVMGIEDSMKRLREQEYESTV